MTNKNQDSIKYLKSIIKPNTELLVNIHSVSYSGMTRKMSVYVIGKVDCYKRKKDGETVKTKKNDLIKLNWRLKEAGVVKLDKNNQIIVNGCGMDMPFSLTYNIKVALYNHKKAMLNQQYRII